MRHQKVGETAYRSRMILLRLILRCANGAVKTNSLRLVHEIHEPGTRDDIVMMLRGQRVSSRLFGSAYPFLCHLYDLG